MGVRDSEEGLRNGIGRGGIEKFGMGWWWKERNQSALERI